MAPAQWAPAVAVAQPTRPTHGPKSSCSATGNSPKRSASRSPGATRPARRQASRSMSRPSAASPTHTSSAAAARPGDAILVAGESGLSGAGLRDILAGRYDTPAAAAHRNPQPQVAEGIWLGARPEIHAMMDLSDGLASDIRHIMERSGVGAAIDIGRIPLAQGADVETAACGGEDYKLLLTADTAAADRLAADFRARFGTPLHPVGHITDSDKLEWLRKRPTPGPGLARVHALLTGCWQRPPPRIYRAGGNAAASRQAWLLTKNGSPPGRRQVIRIVKSLLDDVHMLVAALHAIVFTGILLQIVVVAQALQQRAVLFDPGPGKTPLQFKALICRLIFTACKRFRPTTNNVTTTMTAVAAIQNFLPTSKPLGMTYVFMSLDRDIPFRMRLRILDDRGHHAFRNAPLGLQVEDVRLPTRRHCAFGLKSASSPTITFSSCAFPNASSSGGCCRLGDRHTQSKYPEKGCVRTFRGISPAP